MPRRFWTALRMSIERHFRAYQLSYSRRAAGMASTLTPCNPAGIQSLIVSEAKLPSSPIPPQSCSSSFTFEAWATTLRRFLLEAKAFRKWSPDGSAVAPQGFQTEGYGWWCQHELQSVSWLKLKNQIQMESEIQMESNMGNMGFKWGNSSGMHMHVNPINYIWRFENQQPCF